MSLLKNERHGLWPMDPLWPEERVDRVFRDMLRDFFGGGTLAERVTEGRPSAMRLEEFVEGDSCVIRAELPDLDPDKDVEISITDGVLHVRAHREQRSEEKRGDGYRTEFHYGSLQRNIRLPDGISAADVTATYKDGILEVRVPMPKAAAAPEPTKIAVTRG